MLTDYDNDQYILFSLVKISNFPITEEKQNLSDKYKIKKVLDQVLIWLLRVSSQRWYEAQKKSGSFWLLWNTLAI